MAGRHALLIAPTAAGKTEAALLPVFSRMLGEGWRGLSVLYLCPLKALLNNLEPRLSALATLFGRRVGVWHGDVGAADKRRWLREPPDLLLITPESIEALLIGTQVQPRHWFADLRAVIVDELHAFAADDRGWHVLALLERVERLAGRSLQRIGLSATVGNPAVLLDWFAGHCDGERTLVQPPAGEAAAVELRIDYVGSLANAACVIAALHAGEKRLVFCDSPPACRRTDHRTAPAGGADLAVARFTVGRTASAGGRRLHRGTQLRDRCDQHAGTRAGCR